MKIGIVTFYATNNCGAMLQCYALYETIRRLCPKAEIHVLDFLHGTRRTPPSLLNSFKQSYRKSHSVPKAVILAAQAAGLRLLAKRDSCFQEFIEHFTNLDASACLTDNHCLDCSGYDILITGSDQVFAGCQPYFYLDSTQKEPLSKVAYAPSFGNVDNLPAEKHQWVADKLSSFHALSCRETDGSALLERLMGRPCPQVLDPTMLLTPDDWRSIAKRPGGVEDGDFVFSYELWRCPQTQATARRAARELGVPLIRAKYFNEALRFYNAIGPREFIWLIAHAKHVVTHSFHGSVFSLLFGTPFHVIATKAPQSRITTLLSMVNQEDRRIHNSSEWDAARPQPALETIHGHILPHKQQSLEYLSAALRDLGC